MKEFLIPSIPHILTGCQDSMRQGQMHLVKTAMSVIPSRNGLPVPTPAFSTHQQGRWSHPSSWL